jgi:hypothetical protein
MAWYSTVGDVVLNVLIMVVGLGTVGGLGYFGYNWYKKWKRYQQYVVEVWNFNDEGVLRKITTDQAGVFQDDITKNLLLYLKSANVGLNCDNIPSVPFGGKEKIYLLKLGRKNYRFVEPKLLYNKLNVSVGEEDLNWALNTYEKVKKVAERKSMLDEWKPFIGYVIVMVFILIAFIYLFRKADVMLDVANRMLEVTKMLQQMMSGTTVMGG